MTIELEKPTAPSVRPGAQPLAPAGASYLGAVSAVIVIAVGALCVRDALVAAGWIGGATWVADAVGAADGLSPASWTASAGIVVAVCGLALMLIAVKPRRRRAVAADASTAVYVDLTDVARLASAAAETVPGVTSARTTASRRSLTVRCESSGAAAAQLKDAVSRSVTTELASLRRMPRVRVRLSGRGRP